MAKINEKLEIEISGELLERLNERVDRFESLLNKPMIQTINSFLDVIEGQARASCITAGEDPDKPSAYQSIYNAVPIYRWHDFLTKEAVEILVNYEAIQRVNWLND